MEELSVGCYSREARSTKEGLGITTINTRGARTLVFVSFNFKKRGSDFPVLSEKAAGHSYKRGSEK